jgi:hypothetical protein
MHAVDFDEPPSAPCGLTAGKYNVNLAPMNWVQHSIANTPLWLASFESKEEWDWLLPQLDHEDNVSGWDDRMNEGWEWASQPVFIPTSHHAYPRTPVHTHAPS